MRRLVLVAVLSSLVLITLGALLIPSHTYEIDARNILTGPVRLWSGLSPYGDNFFYPYWFALLLLPMAWVPASWQFTAWFAVSAVTMFGGTMALDRNIPRNIPKTFALAVLYLPAVWVVNTGQTAGFLGVALALYMWALRRNRLLAAGMALALLSMKPQLGACIVLPLLFWHACRGEWRVIGGAAGAGVALLGISAALRPAWIMEWREGLQSYYFSPATDVLGLYGVLQAEVPTIGATIAVVAALGWWLWQYRQTEAEAVLAVVVAVAFVIVPVSHPYDTALLLVPIVLLVPEKWTAAQAGLLAALYLWPWAWGLAVLPKATILWPSLMVLSGLVAARRVARRTWVRNPTRSLEGGPITPAARERLTGTVAPTAETPFAR